jgi:hypothetical protein
MKLFLSMVIALLGATGADGQLAVTVSPPKVVGQKAVVALGMKNGLAEKIESARAVCFLLDEQGKVVGQATRWVIGGIGDKPGLAVGATNVFHLVITSDKPLTTTNLTAKVSFNRVVLEGGKLADVNKVVTVEAAKE